jgi:hypothetical protein
MQNQMDHNLEQPLFGFQFAPHRPGTFLSTSMAMRGEIRVVPKGFSQSPSLTHRFDTSRTFMERCGKTSAFRITFGKPTNGMPFLPSREEGHFREPNGRVG